MVVNDMKSQRIENIEQYLSQHKSAELNELCEIFDVSKNTIRRDIDILQQEGKIQKVYGGVLYIDHKNLIPFAQRELFLKDEKKKIAIKASELIKDNDILFVDSGSTTANIIPFIKDKQNITIITNSLTVLNEALLLNNCNVISTGGHLLKETCSFTGIEAMNLLTKLNAHKAFIAASGLSLDNGLTNSSTLEAEIKKIILNVSKEKILLLDHSKFDTSSLVTFANISDIDMIITDKLPQKPYIDRFKEDQVELIIC